MIGGEPVGYPIRRSRRRTVGLTIDPAAGLIVTAPYRVSRAEIDTIVAEKRRWIARHLARRPMTDTGAMYESGMSVLWLGQPRELRLEALPGTQLDLFAGLTAPQIEIRGSALLMTGYQDASPMERHEALRDWVVSQAVATLPERVRHYASRLGYPVRAIRITSPERQWGACSSCGRITLNWRLMLGDPAWADYVAAHEACHLVHRHHQPSFWRLVATLVPEYRRHRKELREAAPTLNLPPPAGL